MVKRRGVGTSSVWSVDEEVWRARITIDKARLIQSAVAIALCVLVVVTGAVVGMVMRRIPRASDSGQNQHKHNKRN